MRRKTCAANNLRFGSDFWETGESDGAKPRRKKRLERRVSTEKEKRVVRTQ